MRGYALPLMITGSLAVLGGLFLLLRAITGDSVAEPPVVATPTKATPPAQAPTASARTPSSQMPLPRPRPRPERVDTGPADPGQAPAPTLEDDAPPGTRLNTKGLHYGAPQLREQIAGNTEHLRACIRDAGTRPTGDAVLTFILARRDDKIIVEQTDIERDQTTVQGEALLECMHQAAQAMRFEGLPREAEAIIVTRGVKLADGEIAEDKFVKFSYIR